MYKDMQEILAAVARGDLSPDEAEFEMAALDNAQEGAATPTATTSNRRSRRRFAA